MHILVTGGAGFIGSHVVDELVANGHEVRVLDALDARAHRCRPEYCNPGAEYVWADVTDGEQVAGAVAGVDAVAHQAAMVGLGVDFGDVQHYVHNNDAGTATLLGALHRRDFAGRFVLASSMVVYGEGRYSCPEHGTVGPAPRNPAALDRGDFEPRCPHCAHPVEPEAVGEDAALDPRNVYAATKVHQEHLCRAYAREHPGTAVAALRYHNVYGPRMPRDTPYAGVASLFRSALERGEAPRVFEDGRQLRDFVHVRDVAHANVLALTGPSPCDGAFNVASGAPRSVFDLAAALASEFDGGALVPRVVGGYRLGDVRHVFASPDRARHTFGFAATTTFDAGVREFATAALR